MNLENGSARRRKIEMEYALAAYEMGVPVFVPAFCDSGLGFSLMFANRRRKRRIIVDHMRDVDESSKITEKARHTAVIVVGGGVPKNFIQQTAVIASYQTRHDHTHDFAIQFTNRRSPMGWIEWFHVRGGAELGEV